jgi:predicted CoA-binding protein
MTQREAIRDFLSCHRIALVGVSSQPKDFSRMLFHELVEHGYDVVPVNPKVSEVEGRPAYARVQDIPAPVDGALLMTPPEMSERVVEDCAEAGIERVWLHRGAGRGAVSDAAVSAGQAHGMSMVPGECPLMFLEGPSGHPGWIHRVHGWCKRLVGHYPS